MENEISLGILNNKRANISECFIASKLRREGYVVRKLARQGVSKSVGYFKPCFVYLNDKGLEDIFKIYTGDKEFIIKLLKDNLVGLPDFICLKDNKISFVEVKTDQSGYQESQKEVFEILRNNGFEVITKRVRVKLEVEEIKSDW